jgi:geranylgeranyl pyrophosphate synthase
MNINEAAHSYLLSVAGSMPIEKATQVIEHRFSKPSPHWLLPFYTGQAYDIDENSAVPAISSLIAIQTAILLIDDLLDNDGRRDVLGLSVGDAANLASVFQAISIDCLPSNFSGIARQINQAIIETAYGQYLDNKNPETEDEYWHAARAKSCPFFGLAFYLGAVAGGVPLDKIETIQQLGRLYGEMVQIHDDLSDSLDDCIGSDWLQGKFTLPILFARSVSHPGRERFIFLMENINDLDHFREAQQLLLQCGAISYCLNEIVERHSTAMELLASLNPPKPQPIIQMFDQIILPVTKLLELKAV